MFAFEDLTPYQWGRQTRLEPGVEAYYVGWLGKTWEYPRGEVSPDIPAKLEALRPYVKRASGVGFCPFCLPPGPTYNAGGHHHIVGERGEVYVAPALISHHIRVHGYRPPDVFLEAVRRTPISETLGPPEPLAGEPGVG